MKQTFTNNVIEMLRNIRYFFFKKMFLNINYFYISMQFYLFDIV